MFSAKRLMALLALLAALVFAVSAGATDYRIQYDEPMTGAAHPTLIDTLNRLHLADHNTSGTGGHLNLGQIEGLRLRWKDSDEITIEGGSINVAGYTYQLNSSVDKQCTSLNNDDWYYLLAEAPSSGKVLTTTEITYSATAPTWDDAQHGYYDATGTKRCFGVFKTDGSGNILPFYFDGAWFHLKTPIEALNTSTPATTGTLLAVGAPEAFYDELKVRLRYSIVHGSTAPAVLYLYEINPTGAYIALSAPVATSTAYGADELFTNDSGQVGYLATATSTVIISFAGFRLPAGMAR